MLFIIYLLLFKYPSNQFKIVAAPSNMSHQDHQYAFDISGNWVNAQQTKFKQYQIFFCECPQKHKMKLVKPSGRCDKRPFCDYFAHVQPRQKGRK